VRVAPPDDAVFVTLLAEREGASADEAAAAAPPMPVVPAPPAIAEAAPREPRLGPAAPAAAPKRAPRPSGPAPATGAAEPAGTPDAHAGGVAEGAAVAVVAPPSGGSGAGIDAARVYGEGEVDRVAAPVGGIRRPEYPARERMMGREGRVSLVVTVDADGAVRDVAVARSGGDAFDGSARRAVQRTPFRAARLADQPVSSTVTVDVSFELD
jgi:protein TonB